MTGFNRCRCYYTHNIYIKDFDRHFTFIDGNQFENDYGKDLQFMGCDTTEKKNLLLKEISSERNRRKDIEKKSIERKKLITNLYVPLDLDVYQLQENSLDSSFLKLVEISKNSDFQCVSKLLDVISTDKELYGFPVFTSEFCSRFLTELKHFEKSGLPKERPNTMNRCGVLLDEIGFHDNFSKPLRVNYLDPLAKVIFPEWRGQGLDSHKIFTVGYTLDQDLDLGYHYDNCEVTLNVCMGNIFEGGELYFGDLRTTPVAESTCILVPHRVGYGIFHRSQQLHGALPVTTGERQNLIFWMRSSSIRNSNCPMCNLKPVLIPSSDYGDGFTQTEKVDICNLL